MEPTKHTHDILVGVDFTPVSELALTKAWGIAAGRPDARLHLVHVIDDDKGLRSKEDLMTERDAILDRAPPAVREHALELAGASELPALRFPFSVHVRFGAPAQQIMQLAADLDADLIVVGSRGESGLRRLLGSVSRKLVTAGRLPVMVVRPKALEDMRRDEELEPPCPECVAIRAASHGRRFWCEVHGREHAHVHGYTSTQRVSYAKTPFDTHGLSR